MHGMKVPLRPIRCNCKKFEIHFISALCQIDHVNDFMVNLAQ